MELQLGCIADSANVNEGHKLDLFGLRDLFSGTELPIVVEQIALAVRFGALPQDCGKEFKIEVKLLDSDGELVHRPPTVDTLSVPDGQMDLVNPIARVYDYSNVRFARAGKYRFEVCVNGERLKDVPFKVVRRSADEAEVRPITVIGPAAPGSDSQCSWQCPGPTEEDLPQKGTKVTKK